MKKLTRALVEKLDGYAADQGSILVDAVAEWLDEDAFYDQEDVDRFGGGEIE